MPTESLFDIDIDTGSRGGHSEGDVFGVPVEAYNHIYSLT